MDEEKINKKLGELQAWAEGGGMSEDEADELRERTGALVRAYEDWAAAREYAKGEGKRCNDNVKDREAELKEAMESGHSTTNEQLIKLTALEQRWQALEDAKSERTEMRKVCKESVKETEQRLMDAMAESKQMRLFSSGQLRTQDEPF